MSKISFVSVIFPSLVEKSEISNILISVQRKYFCIFIDILALRNLLQLLLQTCLICLVQTLLLISTGIRARSFNVHVPACVYRICVQGKDDRERDSGKN